MNWEPKEKLGKAQARDTLPTIVEAVHNGGGPVAITDYGKPVAIIISISDYNFLVSQLQKRRRKIPRPICIINGNLEQASKALSESISESIERTASQL